VPLHNGVDDPGVSVPSRAAQRLGPFRVRHLIGFNVVVAAVLLALVATRPLTAGGPGDALVSVDPSATFYPLSLGGGGLDVGARAPEFLGQDGGRPVDLRDLDGRQISLVALRGRPVWIVFWASWCPPCQQETPDLRSAFEAHRNDGLVVIAVSIQEPPDTVRAYIDRYGLDYTVGLDSTGAIARTYSVFGIPSHYFVDRTGVITDRSFGPLDRAGMEQRIAKILPEKVTAS